MSVQTEIERLQGAKEDIKTAIENKGVTVPSSEKIDNYDTYINQIRGNLQEKTVTPNAIGQTVLPDASYDGLSQVVVNGDANLIPSNVLKDVTIFGTTGTAEPYVAPTLQDKTVTPTASGVTVSADQGYDGLGTVSVDGDINLVPNNIRKDTTVFGVTGTLDPQSAPVLQSKSVTPSANSQTVTPDIGYDGLSSVSVSGDNNLVSSNIKKNVSIFGVTGNYEGSGGGGSSDYNIYMQTTEPESKNGVWIKKTGNANAYFTNYSPKLESFMKNNLSYMNADGGDSYATLNRVMGQVVVGDYLYSFGNKKSYKFNLVNFTKEQINTPVIESTGEPSKLWISGASVYMPSQNAIYTIYGGNSMGFPCYLKYDIDTNTSITQTLPTGGGSILNSYEEVFVNCFNDNIFFLYRGYNSSTQTWLYDFNEQKAYNIGRPTNGAIAWCANDRYIYWIIGGSGTMCRTDCVTKTDTTFLSNIPSGYRRSFMVANDLIYLFGQTTNNYYVYNIGTGEYTLKSGNINVSLPDTAPFFGSGQVVTSQEYAIDYTRGTIYWRTPRL